MSAEYQPPFRIVGRHLAALDGVRGLAIALVMISHFVSHGQFERLNPLDSMIRSVAGIGWIGVDLFFVLSGFLITGILLETKSDPRYFRVFYLRRFVRIFPLYYGFLFAWFFALPLVVGAGGGTEIPAGQQAWYWAYLSNVSVAINGWPNPGFLGHFWSLAIEEQFYLAWPLIVYFLGVTTLRRVCWGLIVLAPALRIALVAGGYKFAALALTPARADVLAAGALLAILMRTDFDRAKAGRFGWILLAAGSMPVILTLALGGRFRQESDLVLSFGLSAVVALCCGIVLLALSATHGRWLHTILTSGFLVLLGKLSYGLYVVHQPLFMGLAKYGFNVSSLPLIFGSQIFALFVFSLTAFTISFAIAFASWHLFEKRVLALKRYMPYEPAAKLPPGSPSDDRKTAA